MEKCFPIKIRNNYILAYFGNCEKINVINQYVMEYQATNKKIAIFNSNYEFDLTKNIYQYETYDLNHIIDYLLAEKYDLIIINQTEKISQNKFYYELQPIFGLFTKIAAKGSQIIFVGSDLIDEVPILFSSMVMGIANEIFKTNKIQKRSHISEFITGPMFSDKTSYLIDKYTDLCSKYDNDKDICAEKICIVKPKLDTRKALICDRRGRILHPTIRPNTLEEIINHVRKFKYKHVLLDEAQFYNFDNKFNIDNQYGIQKACMEIMELEEEIEFYKCGLDQNFEQEPFLTSSMLMSISDKVVKLKSTCNVCKKIKTACYSKKISTNNHGSYDPTGQYITICMDCNCYTDYKLEDIFYDPLLV